MKMKKISDRVYEFCNSNFGEDFFTYDSNEKINDFEEQEDFVEIEPNEIDMSLTEFSRIMVKGLDQLSVEECKRIGLF